jgi:hypothetical protein
MFTERAVAFVVESLLAESQRVNGKAFCVSRQWSGVPLFG